MPMATESRLFLSAETAADLMSAPVACLRKGATFQEALAFFIDRNVTVAPVVGDLGEPIGVLSIADLLIHVRESTALSQIDPHTAGELMTPTVFSVTPDTPAVDVIQDMLRSKVHHLFVIEPDGRIKGVVSTCDVLRHLQ
jgi:CBS domain-containing protein